MPQVSLKRLESEVTTTQGYQLATYIRNNKGQFVGKFVTSGVGLNEHKRRFNSVVKKTVKEKK